MGFDTKLVRMSFVAVPLILTLLASAALADADDARQPVAIAVSKDAAWLYIANRGTGSVSIVDRRNQTVVDELPVGESLFDIEAIGERHLLAVDHGAHQLVLLSGEGATWQVVTRLDIARFPVQLAIDAGSSQCYVSSLWSRTVTCVDVSSIGDSQLRVVAECRLPFEANNICVARGRGMLLVAGSFQASLAVLNSDDLSLVAVHRLPGHNIRGLAVDSDGQHALLAQQQLNSLARSSRDDVHWGNMISNILVSIPLDRLGSQEPDLVNARTVWQLGEPGNAAGDPGAVVIGPAATTFILLCGVGEVAIGHRQGKLRRVPVGRGPSGATLTSSGALFVANRFSDSISVIDTKKGEQSAEIALTTSADISLVKRGERLFFDSRLSHDGWMSCHSCHTDGHTNGQLNDNMSDRSFGAAKRVLSLLGVSETGPWAWNGQVATLEEQVSSSIQQTMQGSPPTQDQVSALVAYLKALPALPSSTGHGPKQAATIESGRTLFESLTCSECHRPPTYTSARTYDVKLRDVVGNMEFNPPSLRGVGRRSRLFHDGRANSLRQVIVDHRHQLNRELTEAEVESLTEFLNTL